MCLCVYRLFTTVNLCLMIQSGLGHSIAMYVVIDMFYNGFRRKMVNKWPRLMTCEFGLDKGFRTFWVIVTCEFYD